MQKKLVELMNEIKSECSGFITSNMWAEKLIEKGVAIPTRCKDCKYYGQFSCTHPCVCHICDENDYCSYGER